MASLFHKDKTITIVGQGIAGSVLAFLLIRKGFRVMVVDDARQNASSRVAAGMWNPVIFTGLKLSWNVAELLPKAHEVYTEMEQVLNARFYHPVELVRIFPDSYAANEWDTVDGLKPLAQCLKNDLDRGVEESFKTPYGYGIVKNSGWLDVIVMLDVMRDYLIAHQAYTQKHLTEEDLMRPEEDLVLCNGMALKQHPWFNWLPLIPNKGQVLLIEAPGLHLEKMVHFGRFLIPVGDGLYKLGGLYEYEQPHDEPTEEVKNLLLQELSVVYPGEVKVTAHLAGNRPTTRDRRPMLGAHPEHPNCKVLNGLGSKGVLLAPYCAQIFCEFAVNGAPLPRELNIDRFLKYRKT